jgi:hypothetical protein
MAPSYTLPALNDSKFYIHKNQPVKITVTCEMLYTFRTTAQYTQTFSSSSLHNIYYLLLLHVSATECGHLQEATNFVYECSIHSVYIYEVSYVIGTNR